MKIYNVVAKSLLIAGLICTAYNIFAEKSKESFRDYVNAPQHVKDFYYHNHANQTLDFVLSKKAEYYPCNKKEMTIWEAIAFLDTIKDESDPDLVGLPQSYHAYQSAQKARTDGRPEWFVLTSFLHDLGKILIAFGEQQWAVVGDTYPVGCKFSDMIVLSEYFAQNPDTFNHSYATKYGIYKPECGFDNLHMSWGHDEYLYQVLKDTQLPKEALYIIRYHSFYAAHREHAYQYFMDDYDKEMLPWLELFSSYDLYTKSPDLLDIESLKPYYQSLVEKFVPGILRW